jgi:GntR family transcriptional regulator
VISIDRSSALPLYAQLKQSLLGMIEAQKLPSGSRLPSEEELVASSGLSRSTVRQALNDLASEGRIRRIHGKGTFVADLKVGLSIAHTLLGFSEDMAQRGRRVSTQVLQITLASSSAEAARALWIPPGSPAVHLKRLRLLDGQPFMVDDIYARSDLCPHLEDFDFGHRSLFQILETEYGIRIVRARRTLRVVGAERWAAKGLGVKTGAPLHLLTDLIFAQTGEPVLFAQTLVHGGRSEFEFDLERQSESSTRQGILANPVNPLPQREAP